MKFSTTILAAVYAVSVSSMPVRRDVDPTLVPDLGATAGKNPTGTGDCDGAVNGPDGKPIKVPCACPPDRQTFLTALNANVVAGHAVNNPTVQVSFPTDSSKASVDARFNALAVTLQNLNGPGKGCPIVSTTLQAQQKAIDRREALPPPSFPSALLAPTAVSVVPVSSHAPLTTSSHAPSPTKAAPSSKTHSVDPKLVPTLGATAGKNPTGTGDCDGAVNGTDGKPVKVPCTCPPSQQAFLAALNKNVAAGHAVNNPSLQVSFPTDNSTASKAARVQAAIDTLQNLNGPGKGCPVASTTLLAQQKALQAPAPAPSAPSSHAPSHAPSQAPLHTGSQPPLHTSSKPASHSPSPTKAAPSSKTHGVDPKLVPTLGATAGKNPTGTGDCDGAVNGTDGKPVKVPCTCPPSQQAFLAALNKNVAAGHAVNNPSLQVSFPTDNSTASKAARVQAAIDTLQNLNGPGKGCPVASTTLLAQQKALQAPAPASSALASHAPSSTKAAPSSFPTQFGFGPGPAKFGF